MKKENDIYQGIDYLQITKNRQPVYTFQGHEIEGKTKTDVQFMLGKMFGNDLFHFTLKIKGKNKNEAGQIRSISFDTKKDLEVSKLKEVQMTNNISEIKKLIEEKHAIEKAHLEEKIKNLERDLKEVNETYNKLADEVEKKENNDNNMLAGLLKYLPLDRLFGAAGPVKPLADNPNVNQIDIDPEIIAVLNQVDYSKLTKEQIQTYANMLNQFISQLPRKGNQQ